jgi:hypothetical protein
LKIIKRCDKQLVRMARSMALWLWVHQWQDSLDLPAYRLSLFTLGGVLGALQFSWNR